MKRIEKAFRDVEKFITSKWNLLKTPKPKERRKNDRKNDDLPAYEL